MRQEAPSTTGQIAPEAWRAMSDAARQAGVPLDQWLRDQLLGTTAAGLPQAGAAGLNNLAELRRRIEELAGQLGRMNAPAADASVTSSPATETAAASPAASWVETASGPTAAPASRPTAGSPASTGSSYADERLASAIREIDQRLEALQLTRRRTGEPAAPSPAAIEAAVAEIAARQSELDRDPASRRRAESAPLPREPQKPMARELMAHEPMAREPVTGDPAVRETPAHEPAARVSRPAPPRDPFSDTPFLSPAPSPPRAASPASAPLRPEAAAPAAPQEAAPLPGTLPVHETLLALQGELAGMRYALATLAPRRAVDELQRVVQQLAERVEQSHTRDEELRGTLAALREAIGGFSLPEHPALLLGRIDALERKLDIVNAKVVDGATVARLQAQAGEIRDLLARALSSDSVRLLAEQVSLLAARVSDMAADEDRAVRTGFDSLEQRLDTLAERIGNQQPPAVALEALVTRLDAIQSGLASARRELPAGMEALVKGLSERIERIERPVARPDEGARFEALGRQIEALSDTVGKAVSGAEISRQLAGIERAVNDVFIQMEETRATFLAPPRRHPPSGPGGPTDEAATRVRREIAALEESHDAAAAAPGEPLSRHAGAAVAAERAGEVADGFAGDPAPAPAAAPEPATAPVTSGTAAFTPAPASIPKSFEPQLMRAALEALSRSSVTGRPAPATDVPHAGPEPLPATETAPSGGPEPMADDSAPTRAAFIAQARRAAQPASGGVSASGLSAGPRPGEGPPPLRSHIAARRRPTPDRWLARIRAMLFIGLCGSALAYGSWHLLAQFRQEQLRAAAPATVPGPEDITGSVGGGTPRGPATTGAPVLPAAPALPENPLVPEAPLMPGAPAPVGPSSLSLPNDLPGDLPGGIASQALRAAALGGDPAAAVEIARRFMEGEGVAPSPAHAAQWYAYAAARGSAPAAYRLGALYEKGADGLPRDAARARALYEQAADAGNVAAMHNLGVMLASGTGGPSDYAAAARWFTGAAERGVRDSQYNLAVLYARGAGVPASAVEAWRWFALAAARGDREAAAKRDILTPALDAGTLADLRRKVEEWTPIVADARANDMSATTGDEPRKTASR